jgi:hypothetical protein
MLSTEEVPETDGTLEIEPDLSFVVHPVLAESPLMKLGYDPSKETGFRWTFIRYTAIPNMTREGVINTLFALRSYYDDYAPEYPELLEVIDKDLDSVRSNPEL